jgi:hypothetical protein
MTRLIRDKSTPENRQFWELCERASHKIAFTPTPWRYGTESAGRLYWAREFFKRLHPATVAYAGKASASGPIAQGVKKPVDNGDQLAEATAARGALLELK